ncbi:MAG: hypothetical protein NVS4B3_05280 [Gemmatimonadaceae bacterium]
MVFRRPNRPTWYVEIETPRGARRKSTRTSDEGTARAIGRAVSELVRGNDWDLLNAILADVVSLNELVTAHSVTDFADLRRRVSVTDIEPLVSTWIAAQRARLAPDTAQHYLHAVRTLIPAAAPFAKARFTTPVLEEWLCAYAGEPATRRKAHAAMTQFARYLVHRGILDSTPMSGIRPPPPPAPRERWIGVGDMIRLASRQSRPFSTLSALLGGTGLELAAALKLTVADIDAAAKEIRAPGPRPRTHNRLVRVADWAWPFVSARMEECRPGEALFSGINRWQAQSSHATACRELGLADYYLRDQRRSFAVSAAAAGVSPEVIAEQLGHATSATISRACAAFFPRTSGGSPWSRIAAAGVPEDGSSHAVKTEWCVYHPVYRPRVVDRDRTANVLTVHMLGDLSSPADRASTGTGGAGAARRETSQRVPDPEASRSVGSD